MKGRPRIVLVGLDCLEPSLAFAGTMPFLQSKLENRSDGRMRSCTPPITVPAWASMLTGKDPGELGVYGFRNRTPRSYDLERVDGRAIGSDWIWDHAQQLGLPAAALFVPGQSPIRENGITQLACFLREQDQPWCWDGNSKQTEQFAQAVTAGASHAADVPLCDKLEDFADGLFASGKYRFEALTMLIRQNRHALVCFVDLGADRLHHQCFEDAAADRESDAATLIRDYYAFLDAQLQRMHREAQSASQETIFLVVSDHGAQRVESAFYLNRWLEQHGYLRRIDPNDIGPLRSSNIAFADTSLWAEGGYYGRIMINQRGREPHGIVPADAREALLARVRAQLAEEGARAKHVIEAHTAEELYREVRGHPPDLFVSVDNYAGRILSSYRAASCWGTYADVQHEPGRHGCNHALDGVAVAYSTRRGALAAPRQLADVYAWLAAYLR